MLLRAKGIHILLRAKGIHILLRDLLKDMLLRASTSLKGIQLL
jgi:hypothetical protein